MEDRNLTNGINMNKSIIYNLLFLFNQVTYQSTGIWSAFVEYLFHMCEEIWEFGDDKIILECLGNYH